MQRGITRYHFLQKLYHQLCKNDKVKQLYGTSVCFNCSDIRTWQQHREITVHRKGREVWVPCHGGMVLSDGDVLTTLLLDCHQFTILFIRLSDTSDICTVPCAVFPCIFFLAVCRLKLSMKFPSPHKQRTRHHFHSVKFVFGQDHTVLGTARQGQYISWESPFYIVGIQTHSLPHTHSYDRHTRITVK